MALNAMLNLHNTMEKHHIAYWFSFLCKDTFAVLDHVTMMGTDKILYAERNPLLQIENVLFTVVLLAIKRRKTKLKRNRKCLYSKMMINFL